jgi:hypothetical protein
MKNALMRIFVLMPLMAVSLFAADICDTADDNTPEFVEAFICAFKSSIQTQVIGFFGLNRANRYGLALQTDGRYDDFALWRGRYSDDLGRSRSWSCCAKLGRKRRFCGYALRQYCGSQQKDRYP